jgi:hypothetical protein
LLDTIPAIQYQVTWRYIDGDLPFDQLHVLLTILSYEQPSTVLEIGTFMGSTTRAIAEILPTAEIHTVDLPLSETVPLVPGKDKHLVDSRDVGREFRGLNSARIIQHFRNTLEWNFEEVGHPDFIFIDGDHSYEGVRNDSEKCLAIADYPTTMMWHDCDEQHPGVVKLLEEWRMLGRSIFRIKNTSLAYWSDV